MSKNKYILRVDLITGATENNLQSFWQTQGPAIHRGAPPAGPVAAPLKHHRPTPPGQGKAQTAFSPEETKSRGAPAPPAPSLAARVKEYCRNRYPNKNCWTEEEVLKLAQFMQSGSQNPRQAAARVGRSPRACQLMYKILIKKGVI